MNICINARDAMPDGGLLKITAENIEVDDNYAQINPDAKPGEFIVIIVEDGGVGMSAEVMSRIFDPFFTTKEVGKGTGLGLSTTHSIVRSHGGFLNVYSELGKGSRFSIYLPAVGVEYKSDFGKGASQYPKGNGELILVVDDEDNIREITKATLERFGYNVITATDGADAMGMFAQHKDDVKVVLTDIAMPYLDGPGLVGAIKRTHPDLKVVAMSGILNPAQTAELESLKVTSFLAKPFTAEKLLTTLALILQEQ
jgi:CheY-like chemotaxis protein